MKKVCKKWIWANWLVCFVAVCFLTACTEVNEPIGSTTLKPDTKLLMAHKLYPNDMAKNDSAAAKLAHGVTLVVHPGASYTLSFDIDSTQPAPELQLFRTFDGNGKYVKISESPVRILSPTVVGNRYVYSFNCEENKMAHWVTSLGVNGSYYEGAVKNISFTGIGRYSDHFSINLVLVGKLENTADGLSIEEFSRQMLKVFREKYYGVVIDTLYVSYAHEHPTVGNQYPANEPWVAGYNSEDFFLGELASWPDENLRNSLNIIFVHSIYEKGIAGLSPLFSGDLNEGGSVVVGERIMTSPVETQLQTSMNIILTAIHESGHFFGLRHTTTTDRDLDQYMKNAEDVRVRVADVSNLEDGLTDTPYCEFILRNTLYAYEHGLAKQASELDIPSDIVYQERASFANQAGVYSCPDLNNIMFPVTVDGYYDILFTEQQMNIIRLSLMIMPH